MIRTAGILRKRVLSMINSARWELEQELNTEDLKRLRRDGWLEGDPIPALKEDPKPDKKSTSSIAESPTPAPEKETKPNKPSKAKKAAPKRKTSARAGKKSPS